MTATLPPPVAALRDDIRALSFEHKAMLMEVVREELDNTEPPAWHMELLAERMRDLAEGRTQTIPWETVKAEIREKLGR